MSDDATPAFPSSWTFTTGNGLKLENHSPGMTLRDWFAGQALAGMLACPSKPAAPETWAETAYRVADAMLKARGG